MPDNYTIVAKGMVKSTGKWEHIADAYFSKKDLPNPSDSLSEAVSELVDTMRDIVRGGINDTSLSCHIELGYVVFNPQNFLAVKILILPRLL